MEYTETDYRLLRLSSNEPIEVFEVHVLARAYGAAWHALYQCEPVGKHTIKGLGLVIDFGPCGIRRN